MGRKTKPSDVFLEVILDEVINVVLAERTANSTFIDISEGDTFYIVSNEQFRGEFGPGELDRAYPEVLLEPLSEWGESMIGFQQDYCQKTASYYQGKEAALQTRLANAKPQLDSLEVIYFEECVNNLSHMASTWNTAAQELAALLTVPAEGKTYDLLSLVIEVIDEREEALAANTAARTAADLMRKLRSNYYQKVRAAEAAFDQKASE